MKQIDIDKIDSLPGIRLDNNDTFSFHCHSGLSCFNQCCRNLNLFLYPYDVLRLKHRLDISSDQFLDTFVDVVMRPSNYFPEVLLKMSENIEKTCPFLTSSGCSVYPDRPDTCRSFPVEHGCIYNAHRKTAEIIRFFKPPDFCMGQHERHSWTPETWIRDQEAKTYTQMTTKWAEIKTLFQTDPWGSEGPTGPRAKMVFMATYNIDRFRDFVVQSSFLKRYKIAPKIRKKIKTDDLALLKLGFSWVKLMLWGINTKSIKPKSNRHI